MNRKLHHTVMALSATATVFTVLLLAGTPTQPSPPPAPLLMLSSDAGSAIETAAFIADTPTNASQRRHQRHSRAMMALPYFSFAQGLRRNRS